MDQTKVVREELRSIIDQYHITCLLDIPCGDWYWMQHTDLSGVAYTGADIVEKIIEENQQYAGENVAFEFLDLLESDLPQNDLIFCRDCLVHFSYQDVKKALQNLVDSGSKYLLTTTFPGRKNYDIVTGNWRPIDLEAAPFDLPKPLVTINEQCTEGNGRYADKSMALWDLSQLKFFGAN
jgi:2-polyprenyl-3-methyl-5-hydroxy-6-metoxy-1,4-benzoquinol methylase